MIKNSCLKVLSILFIMFVFSAKAYSFQNTLAEVKIDSTANNVININLLFKNDYKEKAFLQKQQDGSYYVFLPNTAPLKNTTVKYDNIADKSKIRLTIEGKTAIKDEKNYSYTKITTNINPNYAIKLISKKQQNSSIINYIIGAFILLFAILFMRNSKSKQQVRSKSYTYYPQEVYENSFEITTTNIEQPINKEEEKTPSFKVTNKANFDCFNIPQENVAQNNTYEFKSMLKQTSNALNNNMATITHKHSNPITKVTKEKEDDTDLKIPSVSDFFSPAEIERRKKEIDRNINLISVLNITPNKGFYLTTIKDSMALFGFVNNNVFLFKKFNDLTQINLQARFYDKNGNNDIYIVRLDSFKAMIEISDTSMKELARI